ncbi:MAG: hypothetical protein J6Q68_00280 [Clostridia bacterium]|nr:hypothetical protein [Clostridia bacterium]
MERDVVLNGIHIGEHSFVTEEIKNEIYERVIKPGYNFVTIRPRRTVDIPQHYFIEWAQYLAENEVYFVFLYTIQNAPDGKVTHLEKETVSEMKRIAGKYFVGDMIGETGSSVACKWPGYYLNANHKNWDTKIGTRKHADMKAAHEGYVNEVSKLIEIDRELGVPDVVSVEATGLNKYNAEAGVTIPMLELMCGSPDQLVSSLRGMARAFDSKMWGTYVAHEWYGGMRHDDPLKRKRLELAYKYAYLAGTQAFCLESGDELIASYGHRFEADSEICEDYRRVLSDMMEYIKKDERPVGGPRVKVAFVSGLHDAWGGWGGSYVWNQFEGEEWGHNEAEHSWRFLTEIGVKRTWEDIANFGDNDFSATPAYGMYDIVPIEAPVEKLSRYDYLIFLGWNSMTDENMDKLYEYVKRGGNLLMSAAHLNYSVKRAGELIMPSNEKLEKLFGARFTGETFKSNNGVKFNYTSVNSNLQYPGSISLAGDPIYASGYADYAKFEITTGNETALINNTFVKSASIAPAVIENKVGDGVATLITSTNYPGNPMLYPLYRAVAREMISRSNVTSSDIRVLSSDRLRYAVYEGNKMYLLNTDYDMPINVKIIYGDKTYELALASLELATLQL